MQIFSTGKTGASTKYSHVFVAVFWVVVKAKSCHYDPEKLSLYLTSGNKPLVT